MCGWTFCHLRDRTSDSYLCLHTAAHLHNKGWPSHHTQWLRADWCTWKLIWTPGSPHPFFFPTVFSLLAARMCTWRRTSSWLTPRVHAPRPSSTWGRWAPVCGCPRGSTSSSPPPLSPARKPTSCCGFSPRSSRKQSEWTPTCVPVQGTNIKECFCLVTMCVLSFKACKMTQNTC